MKLKNTDALLRVRVQQQGQPWITKKEDNIPQVSWIVIAAVYWNGLF